MDGDDIFSGPDSGELVAFFDDSCLFSEFLKLDLSFFHRHVFIFMQFVV